MDYIFSDPNNLLKKMRAKKIHLLYTAAFSLIILPGMADAKSRDLYFQRIKPWLDQATEDAREIKLQKTEDQEGVIVPYQAPLPWIKEQNEARGLPSAYTPSDLNAGSITVQLAEAEAMPREVAIAPAEQHSPAPVQTVAMEVPLRPNIPEQNDRKLSETLIGSQPVAPAPAPQISESRIIVLRHKEADAELGKPQAQHHPYESIAANHTSSEQDFADANTVSSKDLGEIRGGFMASNGMMIDIGLETRSIVDGVTVEHSNIQNLENIKTDDLQRLVQVNSASQSSHKLNLNDVPNLLTIIQNSRNDVKIDSFAILNIDVSNSARFTMQTQAPELFNIQSISNLR